MPYRTTDPSIARFPPNVDGISKILYLDEHYLVVIVPPVVRYVYCRTV
jgi:hypothetical protein